MYNGHIRLTFLVYVILQQVRNLFTYLSNSNENDSTWKRDCINMMVEVTLALLSQQLSFKWQH